MSALLVKTKGYLLAIGAAVGFLFLGYWRARSDGKAAAQAESLRYRDNLQGHYDEIDRSVTDPADSYNRLRGLSDRKGGR